MAGWGGGGIVDLPQTWIGATSYTHLHVWAAIFLGGAISGLPVYLALKRPGRSSTRHTIAVAQMLTSALLIHLTGGRIETHFHVFGSLAFLAFYRDWRVLVSATVVVAVDHLLRGLFWPQSVFGVLTPSSWRWLEHAGWVIFEDVLPDDFHPAKPAGHAPSCGTAGQTGGGEREHRTAGARADARTATGNPANASKRSPNSKTPTSNCSKSPGRRAWRRSPPACFTTSAMCSTA